MQFGRNSTTEKSDLNLGLDHRVGHLVSLTTEKTPDLIQRGIAIRALPRHP